MTWPYKGQFLLEMTASDQPLTQSAAVFQFPSPRRAVILMLIPISTLSTFFRSSKINTCSQDPFNHLHLRHKATCVMAILVRCFATKDLSPTSQGLNYDLSKLIGLSPMYLLGLSKWAFEYTAFPLFFPFCFKKSIGRFLINETFNEFIECTDRLFCLCDMSPFWLTYSLSHCLVFLNELRFRSALHFIHRYLL